MLAVYPKQAAVFADHPATALILKRYLAHCEATATALIHLINRQTHTGYLGVSKNHCKGRAPQAHANIRVRRRIISGNASFVGGFVQQRQIVVGITGNKDMALAAAQRVRVEQRHAFFIQLDIRILYIQTVNVRPAPRGREQILKCFGFFTTATVGECDSHPTINSLNPLHLAFRI